MLSYRAVHTTHRPDINTKLSVCRIAAFTLLWFFFLSGCDDFSFYDKADDTIYYNEYPLTFTAASATVAYNGTVALAVSGGVPPYELAVTSGPGTAVFTNTGAVYNAPAPPPGGIGAPFTAVIRVTDANGYTAEVSIQGTP
jgi:hypothetical protein